MWRTGKMRKIIVIILMVVFSLIIISSSTTFSKNGTKVKKDKIEKLTKEKQDKKDTKKPKKNSHKKNKKPKKSKDKDIFNDDKTYLGYEGKRFGADIEEDDFFTDTEKKLEDEKSIEEPPEENNIDDELFDPDADITPPSENNLIIDDTLSMETENQTLINFPDYEEKLRRSPTYRSISQSINWDGSRIAAKDMYLNNWEIEFLTPGIHPYYKEQSEVKGITRDISNASLKNVLGVKVTFPNINKEIEAKIKPPVAILEYNNEGRFANLHNGIVKNVGSIKELSVKINTRGQKYRLFIRLINEIGEIKEIFLGDIDTVGWTTLAWQNPDYPETPMTDKKKNRALAGGLIPYLRFDSFVIRKPEDTPGGDCILYFQDMKITYNKAFTQSDLDTMENDEKIWGIRKARAEQIRKEREREYAIYLASKQKPEPEPSITTEDVLSHYYYYY